MILTTAWDKISSLEKRIRIIQGSSSASKTYSVLQKLILQACESKEDKLISIVTDTHPNMAKGAFRDFENILKEDDIKHRKIKNPLEISIGKWLFEFWGLDDETKARGGRRDILFINEADRVKWETARQLIMRTHETVYIDYNPVAEFWAHNEYKDKDDADFIIVTYLDNEACPKAAREEIERFKELDPEWFKVYGEGQLGDLFKGKVFRNWQIVDDFPNVDYWYGLDFGFSNDPTAIVRTCKHNDNIYIDELLYQTGLTNSDIANFFKGMSHPKYYDQPVICDSAEPKSIHELKLNGINAIGADKKPGSIMEGIDHLKRHNVFLTRKSSNILKEYKHYSWIKDREGNYINKPVDMFNHGIDAIRYAYSLGKRKEVQIIR